MSVAEKHGELIYVAILASRYQAFLEKETRDRKHGKSRKLTKKDKLMIQEQVKEANTQFESEHFHRLLEQRRAEFVDANIKALEEAQKKDAEEREKKAAEEAKAEQEAAVTAVAVAEKVLPESSGSIAIGEPFAPKIEN